MTVATFVPSDFAGQNGATYFPLVDGDIRVMGRTAAAFAPHQTPSASMTVAIDAGGLLTANGAVEVAAQTTGTIVAPTTNPRVDRVVIDRLTGVAGVVTGTEASTPVAPALPAGKLPIATVRLDPGITAITNAVIIDGRLGLVGSVNSSGSLIGVQRFTANGTYTPTPGTNSVIVEAIGGGASGGGCSAAGSGQAAAGGGGGAGSYGRAQFTSGFAGVAVTVAAGVPAGAAGAAGANGNASSFGNLLTVPGGSGGTMGAAITPPGITWGSNTSPAPTGANLVSGNGVSGTTGLILSSAVVFGGRGGASIFSSGSSGSLNGPGSGNATFPGGAGGGGGSTVASGPAQPGGAGAAGLVIVYEYA